MIFTLQELDVLIGAKYYFGLDITSSYLERSFVSNRAAEALTAQTGIHVHPKDLVIYSDQILDYGYNYVSWRPATRNTYVELRGGKRGKGQKVLVESVQDGLTFNYCEGIPDWQFSAAGVDYSLDIQYETVYYSLYGWNDYTSRWVMRGQ